MKHLLHLLLASCCLAFLACSDPTSTPNVPSGKDPLDPNFIIKSLEADSLYFGESGRIRGRGLGNDTAALKLFAGSVPLSIVAVNDTTLDFIVSSNASEGVFRLYKHDTLAGGKVNIFVTKRAIDANSVIVMLVPTSGYEGERLKIFGTEMIFRRRDTKLMFGTIEAHIDSVSNSLMHTTIPYGVQNCTMRIETPWQSIPVGEFNLLERPSSEIFSSNFRGLALSLRLLVKLDRIQLKDSTKDQMIIELSNSYYYELPTASLSLQTKDDSLVYAGMVPGIDGDTMWIDVRLKLDTISCTASGSLRLIRSQIGDNMAIYGTDILLRLEKVIYRNYDDRIEFLATQLQSPDGIWLQSFSAIEGNGDLSSIATLPDPLRLDDPGSSQIDPKIQIMFLKD